MIMFYDIESELIVKKCRSYHALYDQQGRDIFDFIRVVAHTYLQMKADRDYWKKECCRL